MDKTRKIILINGLIYLGLILIILFGFFGFEELSITDFDRSKIRGVQADEGQRHCRVFLRKIICWKDRGIIPPPGVTPTPISTLTPTPIPPSKGVFPLVIGVDSSNLDWWNSKAQSSDFVIGNSYTLSSVSSAKGGRVMLVSPTTPATDMDTAKSKGWNFVTANIEDPNTDLVIGGGVDKRTGNTVVGVKEQYQMAKDRGLTFISGPVGIQVEDDWDYTYQGQDHALVRNADIIAYQAQHFQDSSFFLGISDPTQYVSTFALKVKDLISKIKPYIVQQKVWVQVSANPPDNRCTTSDQVIKYIDSVTTGSQPYADAIVIFVSSQYDSGVDRKGDGNCVSKGQPARAEVVKQIVDHYR